MTTATFRDRFPTLICLVFALSVGACDSGDEPGAAREGSLAHAIEGGGRVATVEVPQAMLSGVDEAEPANEAIRDALAGDDEQALLDALQEADFDALAVSTQAELTGLGARFASYDFLTHFRGAFLHPDVVLYIPRAAIDLGEDVDLAAPIARRILEGAPRPNFRSFPASYRRRQGAEVMVLLREDGRARLWRSSRDSSVAEALVTAATIARSRWNERNGALGGSIDDRLMDIDVEVAILEDDGRLADTSSAFVDRVFGPEHGVAYEEPTAWRYLLPDATAREGEGSAVQAYASLFRDDGKPESSLDAPGLRLYRLVVTTLGVDRGGADGLSPSRVVDDVDAAVAP